MKISTVEYEVTSPGSENTCFVVAASKSTTIVFSLLYKKLLESEMFEETGSILETAKNYKHCKLYLELISSTLVIFRLVQYNTGNLPEFL